METVGDVGFGGACIEIKEENAQIRIQIFVTVLNALTDNVVGYAAEGLERDNLLDTMFCQVADLSGQKPPFAEVCRRVDDLAAITPDVHNVGEGAVERETTA